MGLLPYFSVPIGWTAKEIDYEPPWTSKGGWKNILKVNFSLSFKRLCLIYLSILSYHYVLRKKMISLKRSFQSQQQTSLSKQIGGCIRPTGLLCVLCFLFKKSVLVAELVTDICTTVFFQRLISKGVANDKNELQKTLYYFSRQVFWSFYFNGGSFSN